MKHMNILPSLSFKKIIYLDWFLYKIKLERYERQLQLI